MGRDLPLNSRHLATWDEAESPERFDARESAGLFVGVAEFEDHYPEVSFAADDAIDLAHQFCIKLELVNLSKSVLCYTGKPEKTVTQNRLKELKRRKMKICSARQVDIYRQLWMASKAAGENGLFLVTIATHGGQSLIAAADTLERFEHRTGVLLEDLRLEMERSPARRGLILIDACRRSLEGGRGESEGGLPAEFLEAMAGVEGLGVIFGAPVGGLSFSDPEQRNGVFTAAMMEGLNGEASRDSRGFITSGTLRSFVEARIQNWAHSAERILPRVGISVEGDEAILTRMPLSSARVPRPPIHKLLNERFGIQIRLITKGRFEMGSPRTEYGAREDEVFCRVSLSCDFWISETPVTQGQFNRFVEATGYKTTAEEVGTSLVLLDHGGWARRAGLNWQESGGPHHPVVHISWIDACAYCQWLSEEIGGGEVRLPTEAEWEYSARSMYRAETRDRLLETLAPVAWFDANSRGRAHEVGQKKRNERGLFDMFGNVWEWGADAVERTVDGRIRPTYRADMIDPRSDEGSERVLRGGSFNSPAEDCRTATRNSCEPKLTMQNIGFRIVCDV